MKMEDSKRFVKFKTFRILNFEQTIMKDPSFQILNFYFINKTLAYVL
jgi:hypothetical protein